MPRSTRTSTSYWGDRAAPAGSLTAFGHVIQSCHAGGMDKRRPLQRGYRVWAALEHYELKRDWATHELQQILPSELGVVHAFGGGDTGVRDPEYFYADGPYALCGQHVKVRLAIAFPSADEEACPVCVELVAAGRRTSPNNGYYSRDCDAIVHPAMEGQPEVVSCAMRDDHDPPHRSRNGDTWETGPEDFTPSHYAG